MTSDAFPTPKQRRLELVLIVAFWTFLALVSVTSEFLEDPGRPEHTRWMWYSVARLGLWAFVTPFIFGISSRFDFETGWWPVRLAQHLVIAFIAAFLLDLIGDIGRIFFVLDPNESLADFNPLADLFQLDVLLELMMYFAILAAGFARNYFYRYQRRRDQMADLQADLMRARLRALRMQLNPHFLFNTLHAISALVERDPKGVRNIVARLSELLRYTLEGEDRQEIPMRQEQTFLDRYLEIQEIRFGEKLEVERDISEDVLDALVPTFITQPLVENAIQHGTSKVKGVGCLTVRVTRDGSWLNIEVIDNGPGIDNEARQQSEGPGTGLANVKARLEALYGDQQHLSVTSAEANGTVAHVRLPYHTSGDMQVETVRTDAIEA